MRNGMVRPASLGSSLFESDEILAHLALVSPPLPYLRMDDDSTPDIGLGIVAWWLLERPFSARSVLHKPLPRESAFGRSPGLDPGGPFHLQCNGGSEEGFSRPALRLSVYFFKAPNTFCSTSVVRATGFCRICFSSSATILNSPSIALLVT